MADLRTRAGRIVDEWQENLPDFGDHRRPLCIEVTEDEVVALVEAVLRGDAPGMEETT